MRIHYLRAEEEPNTGRAELVNRLRKPPGATGAAIPENKGRLHCRSMDAPKTHLDDSIVQRLMILKEENE
jgi:hypothetical protein